MKRPVSCCTEDLGDGEEHRIDLLLLNAPPARRAMGLPQVKPGGRRRPPHRVHKGRAIPAPKGGLHPPQRLAPAPSSKRKTLPWAAMSAAMAKHHARSLDMGGSRHGKRAWVPRDESTGVGTTLLHTGFLPPTTPTSSLPSGRCRGFRKISELSRTHTSSLLFHHITANGYPWWAVGNNIGFHRVTRLQS